MPGPGRVVLLEGASNVRDLGGLTTMDGRRTRFGSLYRSDAPSELTARDVQTLVGERGVRHVVDLRSPQEVERDGPGPLRRAGLAHAHFWMSSDPGAGRVVPEIVRGNLAGHYLGYLGSGSERVVAAARLLADPANQPALVHCAAGKDRTGTLIALLLDAAGVRREEIVADYALTDANMGAVFERVVRRLATASSTSDPAASGPGGTAASGPGGTAASGPSDAAAGGSGATAAGGSTATAACGGSGTAAGGGSGTAAGGGSGTVRPGVVSAADLPDEARRARAATMAAFLDQLTTVFGGGGGWLLAHGFPDAELQRFRATFLTG